MGAFVPNSNIVSASLKKHYQVIGLEENGSCISSWLSQDTLSPFLLWRHSVVVMVVSSGKFPTTHLAMDRLGEKKVLWWR